MRLGFAQKVGWEDGICATFGLGIGICKPSFTNLSETHCYTKYMFRYPCFKASYLTLERFLFCVIQHSSPTRFVNMTAFKSDLQ